MATQQELRQPLQTLRRATQTSQLQAKAKEQFKERISLQQQQISQEITERESKVKQLQEALQNTYSKRVKKMGVHYLGKKETAQAKKQLALLEGELEAYKEAEGLSSQNQLVQISDDIASKYAQGTISYQQAQYSLEKVKQREREKEKATKKIMEEYDVGFREAQKIRDTKTIITTYDLPAETIRPQEYIEERIIPKQTEQMSGWEKVKTLFGFTPIQTELVVTTKSFSGELLSERQPTEEEKTYYQEQIRIQQESTPKETFLQGVKRTFKEEGTVTGGALSVLGYSLKTAEERTIQLEQSKERNIFQTIALTQKSPIEMILPTPPELRMKKMELIGGTAPYFIPIVGVALMGAEAGELLGQRVLGGLSESPKLSKETREKFALISPAYQKAKIREEQLITAGFDESLSRQVAFFPMDIKIAAGTIAVQSYLARNPIITKGKITTQTYLVPEKVKVGGEYAKSQYSILQKTSQTITTEKRGLIIFGERTSTQTYESFYRLSTFGNVVVKDGNAYGLLKGQREGARMSKLYELRGTATKVESKDILNLPKAQRELFGKVIKTSDDSVFQLGDVQLKELGKFKYISKDNYLFIPKGETGRTITTTVLAGKTEPLKTLGIGSNGIYIGKEVKTKDLFFTEVSGKRLGEGIPRAGGKIRDLNILTKVEYVSEEPVMKILSPSQVEKTPFWKTFSGNVKYYETPVTQSTGMITSSPYQSVAISSSLSAEESLKVASESALFVGGAGLSLPAGRFTIPLISSTDSIGLFGSAMLLKTPSMEIQSPIELLKSDTDTQLTESTQIQEPVTIFKQGSTQIPFLETELKLETISAPIFKERIPKPIIPQFTIKPPTIEGLAKAMRKIRQMPKESFGVFVKKFGKDIKVGEFGTLGKAKEVLVTKLRTTLRAGGFITKEGKPIKAKSLGLFGAEFRPSKQDEFRIVERRERRLKKGSPEVRDILGFRKGKKARNIFGL